MDKEQPDLASKLALLRAVFENLRRPNADWAATRTLAAQLGAGQPTASEVEQAKELLHKYRGLFKENPELEWATFGSTIAGSRWFSNTPDVGRTADGRVVWKCPTQDCLGEMAQTGSVWPTAQPGYHHQCDLCSFTAAIKGAVFGELASD